MRRIPNPISKTYLIFFIFAVSLLIATESYLYYKYEKKITHREIGNNLKAISELKINELVSWRNERMGNAQVISQMPFIIDYLTNSPHKIDSIRLKKLFSDILKLYNYEAIFIAAKNGDVIYSVGSEIKLFGSETKEKIITSIEQNNIYTTDFYYCKLGNTIHYDIIAPVKNPSSKPIAAIIFRINPNDFIYPHIQSWPTPSKTSETLILKEENDSVLFLNELRYQKNTTFSLKIPLTKTDVPAVQAILGYKGVLKGKDYRGEKVMAYVGPVPETDWFMVAKVDKHELLKELRIKLQYIILAALFIFLFFGTGIVLFYNSRQKNIFNTLAQAQEEFRTTLYSIGDAVITTDSRGRIKNLNKMAEYLTGWKESEAIGKKIDKIFNLINEETRKKVKSPFDKIIQQGKIIGLANHTILITRQGIEIPISDSGAPIRDKKDKIIGTVLVFRDQTEERKRQKFVTSRLRLLDYAANHTVKEILNKTLDELCSITVSKLGFYYLVDTNHKTLCFQSLSCRYLNKLTKDEKEKLVLTIDENKIWEKIVNLKKPIIHSKSFVLTRIKTGKKNIEPVTSELLIPVYKTNKMVAIIGLVNKATPYDIIDTEIAAYLVDIAWEIAEQKETEETLEEERRIINSLINSTPDCIYFKDKKSRFIRINKALATKFGLKNPDDAIGKTDFDFHGEEHAKQAFEDEQKIIKSGKALINYEEKEEWKDGRLLWVSSTKIPLQNRKGKITGIMGISRDITHRKMMEEELIQAKLKAEQSDKLKTAFLANMSHEIRTPLNGILGFTNILINKNNMAQEEKEHYSSIIDKSSKNLLQVINDILDISRIESGDMKIDNKPFELDNTLFDLHSIFLKRITDMHKNIKLTLANNYKHVILNADENRFIQIFTNLLDNAVKFTNRGNIKFGITRIEDNDVHFFISDTGVGIPKDMHDIIFDRFRQAELSYNRVYGGNGLGLSIVKKLIELMGGNIWLTSELNKGTTFEFKLPYDNTNIPLEDKTRVKLENMSDTLLNILVVEDNSESSMFMEEILENKCSKLYMATNGKEALEKIKLHQIDLILMDIRLPDADGLDLVREIRKTNNSVYIIAQTAFVMQSDEQKAIEAGCNDYLAKPVSPEILFKKIALINS